MRDSELDPTDFRPLSDETGSRPDALERFGASLRAEAEALEAPDFEELARAVDGEQDPAEHALWQERLACDPELARRAADLDRFRAEIDRDARVLPLRRKPAKVSLSGWLAAAAVLLLVVAVREVPRRADEPGSPRAAEPAVVESQDEPLFADGFEGGDASGWSDASPAG